MRELCIVTVPSLSDYKYLQKLFQEISLISQKHDIKIFFFSPPKKPSTFPHLLIYPFKIILLILYCQRHKKVILHLHWIEFLYKWGNHRWLIPVLTPFVIAFFKYLKKYSKIKIAVTLHNPIPHDIYWKSIEYAFFWIMLREIADCIFVHTDFSKKFVSRYYDLKEKKIVRIEHGLFRTPRTPNKLMGMQLREKLNFSQSDVVFCFVGRISKYKQIDNLLEAIRKTAKKGLKKTRFIIVGKPDKNYVNYLFTNYNDVITGKRLIFRPEYISEKELEMYLEISDFGVCPYLRATTPSTLLDFMSFNLPIITSDDPNVIEILKGYPCILTKRSDTLSLINALTLACNNVSKYKEMANVFDISNLSQAWVRTAEKTFKEYLRIVGM